MLVAIVRTAFHIKLLHSISASIWNWNWHWCLSLDLHHYCLFFWNKHHYCLQFNTLVYKNKKQQIRNYMVDDIIWNSLIYFIWLDSSKFLKLEIPWSFCWSKYAYLTIVQYKLLPAAPPLCGIVIDEERENRFVVKLILPPLISTCTLYK